VGEAELFPQEIVRRKRDGAALSAGEIAAVVRGMVDGSFTDAQLAAFAMAVFLRGMTREETVALTSAMARSGAVLDWSDAKLDGPTVDKHSTGGVGDKVSLVLAPILAACGAVVPMISGRGLGHTGGTLDKLEAIPGYDAKPDRERFAATLRATGCAIIGQTADLAPADRRFYAIRDVTATVESIPLITASILSKKLAAGLSFLVMDVKVGSGAFMTDDASARELARSIVDVAGGAGLPCAALLTDMDQVLGRTAGNALETREAIDQLCGRTSDARLHEVTVALAVEVLVAVGLAADADGARAKIERVLGSGAAAERFARMCSALGGPADILERIDEHLPLPPVRREVIAPRAGFVARVDVRRLGLVVMGLGGGRRRPEDEIDAAVGLADVRALGERVGPDAPVCTVWARTEADADAAARAVVEAIEIGDRAPATRAVVRDRVA
jgi:thymidine phosphorylase